MSGLISANSPQSTPMRPASCFCSGRIVLLPAAEGPLVFITTRMLLARAARDSLRARAACTNERLDRLADDRASPLVGGEVGGEPRDERAVRPHALVLDEQRRDHSRQRAQRRALAPIAGPRARLPLGDELAFRRAASGRRRARLARSPQAREPTCARGAARSTACLRTARASSRSITAATACRAAR